MFWSVIPIQSSFDCLNRCATADIAMRCEHIQIAFTCNDGTDDPHARDASDVRNNVMQLKVHLHQRLLHVLDMGCRILDEPLSLAQVRPQGDNFS